jgi:hypothetical protein
MKSKELNPLYAGSSSRRCVRFLPSACQSTQLLEMSEAATSPTTPPTRRNCSARSTATSKDTHHPHVRRLGLRSSHSGTTRPTTPAHRFINIHAHPALSSNPYDLRTTRPGPKPAIPGTRQAEIPSHTHATCTSLSRPRSHSTSSVPDQPTQSASLARALQLLHPGCHSTQASLRPLCSPNPPAIGR